MVKNLVGEDGVVLADHIWLQIGRLTLFDLHPRVGDKIEFFGHVVEYKKGFQGYNKELMRYVCKQEHDYGLTRITKIRKIEQPQLLNTEKTINYLVGWLNDIAVTSHSEGFLVLVDGSVEAIVLSLLCIKTKLPVLIVTTELSVHDEDIRELQIKWLVQNPNVVYSNLPMTESWSSFTCDLADHEMNLANVILSKKLLCQSMMSVLGHTHNLKIVNNNAVSPLEELGPEEIYMMANDLSVPTELLSDRIVQNLDWQVFTKTACAIPRQFKTKTE
jgi:hypothetical protein